MRRTEQRGGPSLIPRELYPPPARTRFPQPVVLIHKRGPRSDLRQSRTVNVLAAGPPAVESRASLLIRRMRIRSTWRQRAAVFGKPPTAEHRGILSRIRKSPCLWEQLQ